MNIFILLWELYIFFILLAIVLPILKILHWKHIVKLSHINLKCIYNKVLHPNESKQISFLNTAEYYYLIEKKCLLKLEKNYKCICGNKNHFPKIIKSYNIFNTNVFTYCGTSCNYIKKKNNNKKYSKTNKLYHTKFKKIKYLTHGHCSKWKEYLY